MMTQPASVGEMVNQSKIVLTNPSVASFEQYERRGGMREAFIYVAIAGIVAGVVGGIIGAATGSSFVGGLLGGLLGTLLRFALFAFLIYFIGKQFGGTGTQDEVFYTTSLYTAPIQAISSALSLIPILGWLVALVLGIYQIYLGYLATRSSMNLSQNNAIITLVVAFLVPLILVGLIISAIAGAVAIGGGFSQ